MGLRVSAEEEEDGLDATFHKETLETKGDELCMIVAVMWNYSVS